ncbi:MAG: hypothetical protein FVQ82_04240 [Planctomycetes bacterium]|nr:hypothetical protein [Planctomycetota bacterium]
MAEKKLEGTFCLDGLIEGPVFSGDDEQIIRQFINEARKNGITFHLSIDGGRFSILPGTEPVKLPAPAVSADSIIIDCVDKWLGNYSPSESNRLMSTLRSVEYLPNLEKQTLYGIGPAGKTTVEQRTVDADTVAPVPPPDRKVIIKTAAMALFAFCVIIAISTIFIPYRSIFGRLWQSVRPYRAEELIFDAHLYADFFNVDKAEFDKETQLIKITCTTLNDFPRTDEQLHNAWKNTEGSLLARLALESLARGYVLCEFFDSENKFIAHRQCRLIRDPEDNDKFSILIPYDRLINRVKFK